MCHRFISILLLLLMSGATPAQDAMPEQSRKVVARVAPAYPDLAKRMHITGVVKLRTTINATGFVIAVEPVGGNPVLLKAAQDAVKNWKFAPSSGESREVIELRFEAR